MHPTLTSGGRAYRALRRLPRPRRAAPLVAIAVVLAFALGSIVRAALPYGPLADGEALAAARPAPLPAAAQRLEHRRFAADHARRTLGRRLPMLHAAAARLSLRLLRPAVPPLRRPRTLIALRRESTHWQRVVHALRREAAQPASARYPRWGAWMCIHAHEGAWTDAGGPYYGGLQMDLGFQQAYGADLLARKGTADHWTPVEQVAVAERAFASRGWSPWPQTARACGLA